ncbi:hypothetical protein FRC17_000358 [Serendipita sp. 399]|nr:hypothetical protein FRC17_000358 [Serendipita sp. 399]
MPFALKTPSASTLAVAAGTATATSSSPTGLMESTGTGAAATMEKKAEETRKVMKAKVFMVYMLTSTSALVAELGGV